ncbi:predicted protein [Coccidioides posadasii str. Silveira]|uniref:Predicted protein n=1 Tax=Coccidioides posadasii (strain RMSCC 757 / Silveira) TaxID=443226 RepID=E9DHF9_COCPS|nr:predicted protein [Coccidioides posadasii str. Silveira]
MDPEGLILELFLKVHPFGVGEVVIRSVRWVRRTMRLDASPAHHITSHPMRKYGQYVLQQCTTPVFRAESSLAHSGDSPKPKGSQEAKGYSSPESRSDRAGIITDPCLF